MSEERDISKETITQLRYNFTVTIEAVKLEIEAVMLEIDYLQEVFNEISKRAGKN